MHGSRGHTGNCKSRALASDFKKPMNSFFLSSFANALQSKSFDLRYLPAFFLPVHEKRALHWSEHVYWVSPPQLPLPFPCLAHLLLQLGCRCGCVCKVEKQNTHERERERLHQVVYSDSSRLLPAAKPVGIYRYRAVGAHDEADSPHQVYVSRTVDDSLWMNGNCLYH